MARILVVKHLFPYPPSQGTRRVSLALLEDLAARHEVIFLCQLEHRHERALIPQIERLGVRVVAPLMPNHRSALARTWYKAQNIALARLRRLPEVCLYWSNQALRSNLKRLNREFDPDLTILESWETFLLRPAVSRGLTALLAHDAGFQIIERAVGATQEPRMRKRLRARLVRDKRLETEAWRLYDAILTLTESDRETIARELGREEPGGPGPLVRLLPVPVAAAFFDYGRPAEPGRRVGFLANFRADFNRDALAFLLDEVWPRVLARLPAAQLIIAGNGYRGPLLASALRRGARWLGMVEDLRTFFEAIDLLVVPLRFGGGVRIRILEAFAAGVPVVATPVAVAGLNIIAGDHLLLGSDADALATQIAWAGEHPEEAAGLGRRAREWCTQHHAPGTLRGPRLAVIDEILALRPPRSRQG